MSSKVTGAIILLVGAILAASALHNRNFLAKSEFPAVGLSETESGDVASQRSELAPAQVRSETCAALDSTPADSARVPSLRLQGSPEPFPDLTSREECLQAPNAAHFGIAPGIESLGREQFGVVSWNLRFFPFGTSDFSRLRGGTDVVWVGCALAHLHGVVIALQEVIGTAEARSQLKVLIADLNQRSGGQYELLLDDCPDSAQHVGLLYDSRRLRLVDSRVLGDLNPTGAACRARLRPGLLGRFESKIESPSGTGPKQFQVISVHLDSGVTRRDYRNRMRSLSALREFMIDADVGSIVLGDFNTMGCKTCDPQVTPAEEHAHLARVADWKQLVPGEPCSSYYRGRASWLDHGLVSPQLQGQMSASVFGPCRADHCGPLSAGSHAYLSRVSDHCPLRVNLAL